MAQIFRNRSAAPAPTQERPKNRPSANAPAARPTGGLGRLRATVDDITAELRKVTWPTQEETRNLTIVVIGISVFLGVLLGTLDYVLFTLYNLINP
jgi:preprotein translocase subunit SecE